MKRLSVFLAEDYDADIYLVRQSLETRNIEYELLVAQDGGAACRIIAGFGNDRPCPDLMLLDFTLAKADGEEVLNAVRANAHCSQIPILVVSSSYSPKDFELINRFSARYFIKSPNLDDYLLLADVVVEMTNF